MLEHPAVPALNHLLAREAWARERLRPFADRRVTFRSPPLPDLVLEIQTSGEIRQATTEPDPGAALSPERNLTVTIKPSALPFLFSRDDRLLQEVAIAGDGDLAAAVQFLFKNLRWDAEEDLARLVGDAAAHRALEAARSFAAWQKEAGSRLAENIADYLKEEARVLVRPEAVEAFRSDVGEVRDAVERLEKRIAQLARRTRN